MTDVTTEVEEDDTPKKKSPLLLSLILAVAGAGGGFFAVNAGLIPMGESTSEKTEKEAEMMVTELPDIAFVPLDPVTISVRSGSRMQHLRFRAELEVESAYHDDVAGLTPRVLDVLNSYLRAIDPKMLSDPLALITLRAQMLRRVQVVTGRGRVRDLLVLEFVLN